MSQSQAAYDNNNNSYYYSLMMTYLKFLWPLWMLAVLGRVMASSGNNDDDDGTCDRDLSYRVIPRLEGRLVRARACVRVVRVSHAGVEHVAADAFSNLGNLQKLDLSANDLQNLPSTVFANNARLRHLDMSANFFRHLDFEIFSKLRNLQILQLSRNVISHVPLPIFYGIPLQLLDLSHNRLRFFNDDDDHHHHHQTFSNLRVLNLNFNLIQRVRDRMWNFPNLRILTLRGNEIWKIEKSSSSSSSSCPPLLRTLDLSDNVITSLTDTFVENCTELKSLNLSNNGLGGHFENFAFLQNLKYLRNFSMARNGVQRLGSQIFRENPFLNVIELQGNRIGDLSEGVFANLQNLFYLDLSENRIEILKKGTFPGLHVLKISGNPLKVIEHGTFFYPGRFHELILPPHIIFPDDGVTPTASVSRPLLFCLLCCYYYYYCNIMCN